MASGIPLDDDDRRPWLARIAAQLGDWAAHGRSGIITCSALKRAYRNQLREALPVVFVFLDADHALAADRIAHRRGHFMPATLIDSQFAALERPGAGELAIVVAATLPVATQVATVLAGLSAR